MFTIRPMKYLVLAGMLTMAIAKPSLADAAMQSSPSAQAATRESESNLPPVPYIEDEATQTVAPPPEVTQPNGVRYITGGISTEEVDALEPLKHNYNLWLSSSTRGSGAYHGSTDFRILDKDGRQVADVKDVGPLFYATLPAGVYTVQASSNGKSASKKTSIGDGKSATIDFRW